jgi:ATP-binding cassette, subfamily G (WHITE), member 2, SNQ2
MVNEFHNLELLCVPPQLIPPYGSPANQGCALPGSTPGSNIVNGEAYLQAQLTYSYSHLWRNVGIIFAFWAFFVVVTLLGMESILKPHKGGGNVNVYRKGGAPESVQKALEDNNPVRSDEEAQREEVGVQGGRVRSEQQDKELQGIAKSETVFTWSDVRYVIPVSGGRKVLLDDVQGYVKPGRLTALMGGISPSGESDDRIWCWENYFIELSGTESVDGGINWRNVNRWTTFTEIISAVNGIC